MRYCLAGEKQDQNAILSCRRTTEPKCDDVLQVQQKMVPTKQRPLKMIPVAS